MDETAPDRDGDAAPDGGPIDDDQPARHRSQAKIGRVAALIVGLLVAIVLITAIVLTVSPDSDDTSLPTTSQPADWQSQYLECVKNRESQGDYTAVSSGGQAFGAYQITPQSWNNTVAHYGWTDLSGVRPDQATPADQDMVAMGLLEWQGTNPWSGGCSS